MATNYYREPLTKEELKEHSYDYKSGNPSVYVGTYGKYNNGNLYGEWIDLTTFYDYSDFIEFCERMHADEEEPELMFQDFENFPKEYYSETCLMFDKIIEFSELDEYNKEPFEVYLQIFGTKNTSAEDFENRYEGNFCSNAEFARSYYEKYYMEEYYNLPDWARNNINWDDVWCDLKHDTWEKDGCYFTA